ncbi:hypothetical protein ABTM07_19990, partial [Acinetobacter baumannii]
TLVALLTQYQGHVENRRATLRQQPFPAPRRGFMADIYDLPAAADPAAQQADQTGSIALRRQLPLIQPTEARWRPPRRRPVRPQTSVI